MGCLELAIAAPNGGITPQQSVAGGYRIRRKFANSVEELGANLLDGQRRRLVFQAFRLG